VRGEKDCKNENDLEEDGDDDSEDTLPGDNVNE